MAALKQNHGYDQSTAIIVRLEEKVDRLERDVRQMSEDLRALQSSINKLGEKMREQDGMVAASKWWIAAIASIVSAATAVGIFIFEQVLKR